MRLRFSSIPLLLWMQMAVLSIRSWAHSTNFVAFNNPKTSAFMRTSVLTGCTSNKFVCRKQSSVADTLRYFPSRGVRQTWHLQKYFEWSEDLTGIGGSMNRTIFRYKQLGHRLYYSTVTFWKRTGTTHLNDLNCTRSRVNQDILVLILEIIILRSWDALSLQETTVLKDTLNVRPSKSNVRVSTGSFILDSRFPCESERALVLYVSRDKLRDWTKKHKEPGVCYANFWRPQPSVVLSGL